MQSRPIFAALLFVSILPYGLQAQGLTGQVTGTVVDPSGAAVAGAKVLLETSETGQSRNSETDALGSFVFAQLLPGTYRIVIEATGFRAYEQKDIVLSATERVTLRQIMLDIGANTEKVSVTAEAARIQTQSAERSGLISTSQIRELSLKGRDYLGLVHLLPGVVDTANREAPGNSNLEGIYVNGSRMGTINLTLDGVSNLDTGSMRGPFIAPGLDAIAEVKVLLTNYQAEYGRSSGATINVIIKNGTRAFHGGAYYFKRNEAFNANEYFNNRDGLPKPRYRFDYPGYNIGGPVLIPGLITSRGSYSFSGRRSSYPASLRRRRAGSHSRRNWSAEGISRRRSTPTGK